MARSGVCRSAGRDVCRNGSQRASTAARSRSSASASRMRSSPTFSRMCPSPPEPEHLAVVERQSGASDEEVDERIVRQPQFSAVEPDEGTTLRGGSPGCGGTYRRRKSSVKSTFASTYRSICRRHASPSGVKAARVATTESKGRLVELSPASSQPKKRRRSSLVGDDRVGIDHAGDVEGLGRGAEGDAAMRRRVADRCRRGGDDARVEPCRSVSRPRRLRRRGGRRSRPAGAASPPARRCPRDCAGWRGAAAGSVVRRASSCSKSIS